MNDKEFIKWAAKRFINVFGEDKNNDYIHRLFDISDKIQTINDTVVITTKEIAKGEHIVLSIVDEGGDIKPTLYNESSHTSITEGEILLSSDLFNFLRKLNLYDTSNIINEDITRWKV